MSATRFDTTSWLPGATIFGESGGFGVRGDTIPSTGQNGPGYAYPRLTLPQDAGKEICGRVSVWPSAGILTAYENTSFVFSEAPDGSYSFTWQLYKDGAASGSYTENLYVGVATSISTAGQASAAALTNLTTAITLISYANAVTSSQVTLQVAANLSLVSFGLAAPYAATSLQTALNLAFTGQAAPSSSVTLSATLPSLSSVGDGKPSSTTSLLTGITISSTGEVKTASSSFLELQGLLLGMYPRRVGGSKRRSITVLDPMDVAEVDVITFDFTSRLNNETILSASTEVVLMYGTDTSPLGFKIGSPQISGNYVNQKVGLPKLNSHYDIRCTVTTDTRVLPLSCIIQGIKI